MKKGEEHNFDQWLKNQLEGQEASYSPDEKDMDWQSVQNSLPASPGGGGGASGLPTWVTGVITTIAVGTALYVASTFINPETKPENTLTEQVQPEESPIANVEEENNLLAVSPKDSKTGSTETSSNEARHSNNNERVDHQSSTQNNASSREPSTSDLENNNGTASIPDYTKLPPVDNPEANRGSYNEEPSIGKPEIEIYPLSICKGDNVNIRLSNKNSTAKYAIAGFKGNPVHLIRDTAWALNSTGEHTIKVYRTMRNVTDTFTYLVKVNENPVADFTINSNNLPKVTATNNSFGASSYTWEVSDGQKYNSNELTHTFKDVGKFSIMLTATNLYGCSDNKLKEIEVIIDPVVEIPNIFTPNGDHINDYFDIKIVGEKFYELTIIDVSGKVVFKSNDKNNIWDGLHYQTKQVLPSGTYYYVFRYHIIGQSGPVTKTGTVSMIKD